MSRYIDADALKEIIMDMRNHAVPSPCLPYQTMLIPDRMVCDKIDAMPTVDAVPVVRCEDCKYCYAEGFVNVRNVCEKHYDFGNVDDDWFCADGERRR